MTHARPFARAAIATPYAYGFGQSALSPGLNLARRFAVAAIIFTLLACPPSMLCQTVQRWEHAGMPQPYPSIEAACDAALQELQKSVTKP